MKALKKAIRCSLRLQIKRSIGSKMERQFEPNGRIKISIQDSLLQNSSDPFRLSEIESPAEIFSFLARANYNYSLNELLLFFERLCELTKNQNRSFLTSKQGTEFFSQIKLKLKMLETNLRPWSKPDFQGKRPTSSELEDWAFREHQRIKAKTKTPKIGKLSLLLAKAENFDPEIWLTMEKLILNGKIEANLTESINLLEGFTLFPKVLAIQKIAERNLSEKYSKSFLETTRQPKNLLQGKNYIYPLKLVSRQNAEIASEQIKASESEQNFSYENATAMPKTAEFDFTSRMRPIYKILERNMIISMTDISLGHYARAAEAIYLTNSPNNISFAILEEFILTNFTNIIDHAAILKIYKSFALAEKGTPHFFRTLELAFLEDIVRDFRLTQGGNFLANGKNLGELLLSAGFVKKRCSEFSMHLDLRAKICDLIRNRRIRLTCENFAAVFSNLKVLEIEGQELEQMNSVLFEDFLKSLVNEKLGVRNFLNIYEEVASFLNEGQRKRIFEMISERIEKGEIECSLEETFLIEKKSEEEIYAHLKN